MVDSMVALFQSLADIWENLFYGDSYWFYTLFDFCLAIFLNSVFFAICLIPFVIIFRLFDWGVKL